MQGSLETPLRGDPKAEPWEQWETLEHKNEPARLNPPLGGPPHLNSLNTIEFPQKGVPLKAKMQ